MMDFNPAYTPEKMLQLGVFGASYFEMAKPEDFEGIRPSILLLARAQTGSYDEKRNAFGVKAGLHYDEWIKNGWIFEEDPLGWFHWYCRFSSGRRHERDYHQISRWNSYKRWHSQALNQKARKGVVSNVVNQGLLHWSWPVV